MKSTVGAVSNSVSVQVLDAFADVGDELGEKREGDGDIAAEHVAERQVGHRAVRLGGERGIVRGHRARRRQVLAMRDKRALGVARRPGGIDNKRGLLGTELADLAGEPGQVGVGARRAHGGKGRKLGVAQGKERGFVDHQHAPELRQSVDEGQNLVDVLLVLGDEQGGAAVLHLVFDLLGRCRWIDAVDDGAQRLGREVGDQPGLAGVRHDGDTVAALEPERTQSLGGTRHVGGILRPGLLPVDAAVLGAKGDRLGARAGACEEEGRGGAAAQLLSGGEDGSGAVHDGLPRP